MTRIFWYGLDSLWNYFQLSLIFFFLFSFPRCTISITFATSCNSPPQNKILRFGRVVFLPWPGARFLFPAGSCATYDLPPPSITPLRPVSCEEIYCWQTQTRFAAHLFSCPSVRPSAVLPGRHLSSCSIKKCGCRSECAFIGTINGGLRPWTRHQTPSKPSGVRPQIKHFGEFSVVSFL